MQSWFVHGKPEWMAEGQCVGADPAMFVPDDDESEIPPSVYTLCEACTVADDCLTFGVENRETGVWGGVLIERGHSRLLSRGDVFRRLKTLQARSIVRRPPADTPEFQARASRQRHGGMKQ